MSKPAITWHVLVKCNSKRCASQSEDMKRFHLSTLIVGALCLLLPELNLSRRSCKEASDHAKVKTNCRVQRQVHRRRAKVKKTPGERCKDQKTTNNKVEHQRSTIKEQTAKGKSQGSKAKCSSKRPRSQKPCRAKGKDQSKTQWCFLMPKGHIHMSRKQARERCIQRRLQPPDCFADVVNHCVQHHRTERQRQ